MSFDCLRVREFAPSQMKCGFPENENVCGRFKAGGRQCGVTSDVQGRPHSYRCNSMG